MWTVHGQWARMRLGDTGTCSWVCHYPPVLPRSSGLAQFPSASSSTPFRPPYLYYISQKFALCLYQIVLKMQISVKNNADQLGLFYGFLGEVAAHVRELESPHTWDRGFAPDPKLGWLGLKLGCPCHGEGLMSFARPQPRAGRGKLQETKKRFAAWQLPVYPAWPWRALETHFFPKQCL